MTWAEAEFGGADLGDQRLNKRLVLLVDRLGEQPSASIPEACRGASEMHAADAGASGGAVHPGHDRTGFRGQVDAGAEALELRGSARNVCAPDLRGDVRPGTPWGDRRVDVAGVPSLRGRNVADAAMAP